MLFRRLVCLFLLLCPALVLAQDDNEKVITPQNAAQIQQIDHIGGVEPGQLMWSPDGNHLAIGSSEGVQIYDASGAMSAIKTEGNTDVLYNTSGDLIVSVSYVLNARTGESVTELGAYSQNYLSPDGDLLATITSSETSISINLWNIASIESVGLISTLTIETSQLLRQLKFSPDESMIAVGLESKSVLFDPAAAIVYLWDIQSGEQLFTTELPYTWIPEILFGNGGEYLIVASADPSYYGDPQGAIDVYRINPLVYEVRFDQKFDPVLDVDGQWLAMAGPFIGADLVELREGVGIVLPLSLLNDPTIELPSTPQFQPDARTLNTLDIRSLIQYQLLATPVSPDLVPLLQVYNSGLETYLFSPNQDYLAVYSSMPGMNPLIIFNTRTVQQTHFIEKGSPQAFSPDNRYLAVNEESSVALWDLNENSVIGRFPLNVKFNSTWTYAAYEENGNVSIADLISGEITTAPLATDFSGQSIGLNPAAGVGVFIGSDLQLRDLDTNAILLSQPVDDPYWQVIFSQNGSHFAIIRTQLVDRKLIPVSLSVRSLTAPEVEISQIILDELSNAEVTFTPDGNYIAIRSSRSVAGEAETTKTIYDVLTGSIVFSTDAVAMTYLITPEGKFISPDGKLLFSVSYGEIEVWQLDQLPDVEPVKIMTLTADQGSIGVRFSASGKVIAIDVLNGEMNRVGSNDLYLFTVEELLTYGDTLNLDEMTENHIRNVQRYTLSPDGTLVLIVRYSLGEEDPIYLMDVKTHEIYASWDGRSTLFNFNTAGTLLTTADETGISIWDVTQLVNGLVEPLVNLPINGNPPLDIKFSLDDTRLYIRDVAGITVWGLPD